MSTGRTRADFLRFLDWIMDKGLSPANTAAARKSAASKVLGMLSDEEATDVLALDVDDLMVRFQNKNSQAYGPDSILTYRSRLKSSLDDFRVYIDNPVGFRPLGRGQVKAKSNGEKASNRHKVRPLPARQDREPVSHQYSANVLPVQIRPDVTVQIGNLPHDLTEIEARRLANIILAHAVPSK